MLEATLLVVTIVLALTYAYANGMNDAANAIATVISTRVMTPAAAVVMGGVLNAAGALAGTAVARTIGKEIVDPGLMTQYAVISAILATVLWVFFATRLGLPVSVSHSLIASVVVSAFGVAGLTALNGTVVTKVLLALALSPLFGFAGGFLFMVLMYWVFRRRAPATVNRIGSKLQMLAAAALSFSHGRNDGQNAIGIIALAWAVYYAREVEIERWMILTSAAAIGLGTAIGGSRVIRTLGMRVTRLEPIHGFSANIMAASVIESASQFGMPVSTTHTSASSIMGVGATRRFSAVRWGVTRNIAMAWLVTYPVCLVLGYVLSRTLAFID